MEECSSIKDRETILYPILKCDVGPMKWLRVWRLSQRQNEGPSRRLGPLETTFKWRDSNSYIICDGIILSSLIWAGAAFAASPLVGKGNIRASRKAARCTFACEASGEAPGQLSGPRLVVFVPRRGSLELHGVTGNLGC